MSDSLSVTVGCCNARSDSAPALQMVSTSRLTLSSLSARAKVIRSDVRGSDLMLGDLTLDLRDLMLDHVIRSDVR